MLSHTHAEPGPTLAPARGKCHRGVRRPNTIRDVRLVRVLVLAATIAVLALATSARATPADNACNGASPSAAACIGADKLAERAAAECRRIGRPANDCTLPLGHQVAGDLTGAYLKSWLHTAAAFQYSLGDRVPFGDAQWLGTHNSFNSVSDSPTLSHTDSNQQLTLTQQLDIDIRSLELDLHWLPSPNAGGGNAVVVCHGRGPDEQDLGCTNERLLSQVLPEIASWLNAHRHAVLLLYLEDELGDATGYAQTVQVLDSVLRRPGGSSLIYRPTKSQTTSKGCANLPLGITRDDVRARGARVVLVGNCRSGWAADVFGWDDVHVESGSTPGYRPFPACDSTYPRATYDAKLVRYYEDSTWLSSAIDPTGSPAAHAAESLTPAKVAAMTRCGVNLYGFDQLLPDDGRIEASIWSWAKDEPKRAAGRCAVQGADGRWRTRNCDVERRAACLGPQGWKLTQRVFSWDEAETACVKRGLILGIPRTGYDNSLLRTVAKGEVWLGYRLTGGPG
jgi:hypothetical protein